MLAVKTAMATIETIIHIIATKRPGSEFGPRLPVWRWVIATVDHQTPVVSPLARPPPKSSLWRRSKNQISSPTTNANPTRATTAWAKPNDVMVRMIGSQLASPPKSEEHTSELQSQFHL